MAIKRVAIALLLAVIVCASRAAAAGEFQHAAGARLADALTEYRAIQARGGWPEIPDGPTLEQGDIGPRIVALRRRLHATGDLTDRTGREDYDAGVARAVRRFQARHGLAVDGRVGQQTLVALNTGVAARIGQLARNLARWEALPDLGSAYVLVNTAAMLLEMVDQGPVPPRMPVVVGDRDHPTPVFSSHLAAIVFNPDWTVPQSIIQKEILPRLRRDPRYLAANRIRILDRPEDPFGQQVDWRAPDARLVARRLRQDPGPGNSLGLIKFDVPNTFDVYLHDTPAKRLFANPKRAYSHGCIRVSRPRELAAWVLGSDVDSVDRAIASGETTRAPVSRDIAVHVVYLTAFVDPDGTVQFRDDLYGIDGMAAASATEAAASIGCGAQRD